MIYDGTWKKQDLKMAKTLQEYGFTHIYRESKNNLLAAFDNGDFCYEIPWICFMFLEVGKPTSIQDIISTCEVLNK